LHVQITENHPGTDWVVAKLAEITDGRDGRVWLSPNSPAGSLSEAIEAAGMTVEALPAGDYAKACGAFFDAVNQGGVFHLGQGELDAAVQGARKRSSGEAWVFDRKRPDFDISPLAAVTLAAWAASIEQPSVYEQREVRFL
jgi:hypothetical protein